MCFNDIETYKMKLLSCLIENCIVQRMFCLSLRVSNFLSLCPFSKLKYIIIGEHWSCCAGYPEGSNWFCFLLILKNLQDRQRNLKDSIGPLESFRKQIICFEIKKEKKKKNSEGLTNTFLLLLYWGITLSNTSKCSWAIPWEQLSTSVLWKSSAGGQMVVLWNL